METLGSDPPPTDLSFSLIAHLLAKTHRTWNLTVPYFPGCKLFEHPYMSASKKHGNQPPRYEGCNILPPVVAVIR